MFEGVGDHAFAEEPFAEPGVGDGGVGVEFDGAAEGAFGFTEPADAHFADTDGPIEVPFEGVGACEEGVGVAGAEDVAVGVEGAGAIELGVEGRGVSGDPGGTWSYGGAGSAADDVEAHFTRHVVDEGTRCCELRAMRRCAQMIYCPRSTFCVFQLCSIVTKTKGNSQSFYEETVKEREELPPCFCRWI